MDESTVTRFNQVFFNLLSLICHKRYQKSLRNFSIRQNDKTLNVNLSHRKNKIKNSTLVSPITSLGWGKGCQKHYERLLDTCRQVEFLFEWQDGGCGGETDDKIALLHKEKQTFSTLNSSFLSCLGFLTPCGTSTKLWQRDVSHKTHFQPSGQNC